MKKTYITTFKFFLIFAIALCNLASCSAKESNVPDELFSSFTLNIDSETSSEYLVHFLSEDFSLSGSYASYDDRYITYRTDASGALSIDLSKEFDNFAKIMKKSSNIRIAVSATDDPFIRNLLNDTCSMRLYVVEGENNKPVIMCREKSVKTSIQGGKEKDGISLAFPNASFIVKLDISQLNIEVLEDTKFEVFLYDNSDSTGKARVGRICRGFNYWEAPFYKNEIASKSFTLIVKTFAEGKTLSYEGDPITFTFNENGLCSHGSVIRVKLTEHSDQIQQTESASTTTVDTSTEN